MADLNLIKKTLIDCDSDKLKILIEDALAENIPASKILNEGLISGMKIVGEKMESGEMFIPEVLMTAATMASSVEILKPHLSDDEETSGGSVIIGTVVGDLHDIGKNLVSMMLESSGMTVHDLGVDIAPAEFVNQIKEKTPRLSACPLC